MKLDSPRPLRRLILLTCLLLSSALAASDAGEATSGPAYASQAVFSGSDIGGSDGDLNRVFGRGFPTGTISSAPSFLRAASPLRTLVPGGTPYTGTPLPIPGIIQAEDFDQGGEGVAYHDTTAANEGNFYRLGGVDVTSTYAGPNVGWTQAGEWLKYTINVAAADSYTLQAITASPQSTGSVHFEIDGVDVTGPMAIPNTGSWGSYGAAIRTGVNITAGQHVLKVGIDGYGFLFNHITIIQPAPAAPSGLTATAASTTQINLVWADNSSNETGFKIERKTGAAGTYSEVATVGAGVTGYSNTGLSSKTQYFYRVRAVNSGGHSAYSNEAGATTLNVPPTVSQTAPAAGSLYTAPASVALAATASDTDGSVSKVEFYQGVTKLGEDTTAPYTFTWAGVPAGSYSLTAVATDDRGATTTSAAVHFVAADFTAARLDPSNRTGGGGVDSYSRNFNWSLPVVSLPGRAALGLGLTLSYNSLVWMKDASATAVTFDADRGFPGPGFRLGFPRIQPAFFNPQTGKTTYLLVTPTGARVELRQTEAPGVYESVDSSYMRLTDLGGALALLTTDGTLLSFSQAGGEFVCHEVRDRNGNYLSIAHYGDGRIWKVTDTLGRVVTFNYDAGRKLTSITQPWKRETEANPNGVDESHEWAEFDYTDVTLQPQFSNLAVANGQPGTVVSMLSRVRLPDGSYYAFEYNVWGQVWQVTHYAADAVDSGGGPNFSHPLTSTWLDLPGAGASQGGAAGVAASSQADCPRFKEVRVWVEHGVMGQSAEVTTKYDEWAADMASCEMTMPDGTTKQLSSYGTSADKWMRGLLKKEEVRDGGQLVKTTTLGWEHDGASAAPYPTNPRVTKTTVSDPQGNGRTTRVTYTTPEDFRWAGGYQGTLNVRLPWKVEECSDSNCSTVLRTSVTDYKVPNLGEYAPRRILGLPHFQLLYEGAAAGPNLRSKVGYVYDDTAHVEDDQQQPKFLQPLQSPAWQHYENEYGDGLRWRGNVTRVRRYEVNQENGTESGAFTESLAGYNVTGAAVFTRDAGEHLTTLSYADAFYADVNRTHTDPLLRRQTYAYPTAVTDPGGFTSTSRYNYDAGVMTRVETPKPSGANAPPLMTRLYDAAGRPLKVNAGPGGTYTKWEYGASGLYVKELTRGDTGRPETFVLNVSDGAGRTIGVLRQHPGEGTGYAASRTEYDPANRVVRQYNPVEVTVHAGHLPDAGAWVPAGPDATPQGRDGWPFSTIEYDWKGRVRREVNADGSDRLTEYEGCGCAGGEVVTKRGELVPIPGEEGTGRRTRRTFYDVLGRPRMSEALDWHDAVYSSTTTKYDAQGQPLRMREYAGAVPAQEPTAEGDGYQTTTMTYDGYGRLKTQRLPQYHTNTFAAFEYNDDDTVRRVTDPRGVVTDFTYNSRHLLERVAYNPAQSGVPDTPDVIFGYDAAGNRDSMTDEAGTLTYQYDALSRLASETRRFDGLTHRTYTLTYLYNLTGQLKSLTDPFGHTTTYGRDEVGQVTSVTGSGYPAIPQLANGVQFASGLKYRASGAVSAASYGNGRGMTADYDSRLRVTGFHLPGPVTMDKAYQYEADGALRFADDLVEDIFDRSYSYDHAGRLEEAHTGEQARGGTTDDGPYQQTYTYDPFGHSAGQTNVLWKEVVGGGSVQYRNARRQGWNYDAAGSLTFDGLRHYVNDAAGRMRSFNSGLQTYAYDGEGRVARVTRNLEGTTHVYNLRSTVLGGAVVSQLKPQPNGLDTRQDVVYAGGAEVRRDVWVTGERVSWTHEDPASTTVQEGGLTSFGGPNASFSNPVVQLDPVGASVGWTDPAQFEEPPAPPDETSSEGRVYSNPLRPWQGCAVQWLPMPCEQMLRHMSLNGTRSYTVQTETMHSLRVRLAGTLSWVEDEGEVRADDGETVNRLTTRVISYYSVQRQTSVIEVARFSGYTWGGAGTVQPQKPDRGGGRRQRKPPCDITVRGSGSKSPGNMLTFNYPPVNQQELGPKNGSFTIGWQVEVSGRISGNASDWVIGQEAFTRMTSVRRRPGGVLDETPAFDSHKPDDAPLEQFRQGPGPDGKFFWLDTPGTSPNLPGAWPLVSSKQVQNFTSFVRNTKTGYTCEVRWSVNLEIENGQLVGIGFAAFWQAPSF